MERQKKRFRVRSDGKRRSVKNRKDEWVQGMDGISSAGLSEGNHSVIKQRKDSDITRWPRKEEAQAKVFNKGEG